MAVWSCITFLMNPNYPALEMCISVSIEASQGIAEPLTFLSSCGEESTL